MQLLPVLYRQEAGADLDNIFIYLVEQGASRNYRARLGRSDQGTMPGHRECPRGLSAAA